MARTQKIAAHEDNIAIIGSHGLGAGCPPDVYGSSGHSGQGREHRMRIETFGEALRHLRGDMSIREVARLANVGKSYVFDLENGRRMPSLTIATALDRALGAKGGLVSLVPSSPDRKMRCRPDLETSEDITDVLSRIDRLSRAVNPEIICQLRDNLSDIVLRYGQLDHSDLVPMLLRQRTWIDTVLAECSYPRERQQLFEIASETSGILGYIAVGRGRFPLARAYCAEAFLLGDFAQNPNLQAWVRGMQSFCEYYAGEYNEALSLAVDGLTYANSGPQSVRLKINCAARAMGKLGDAEGVHRAVDEAYDLMSRNCTSKRPPSSISLECYGPTQVAGNAATAYVSLGMPEEVQRYVGIALPGISNSESPWSRSLVMIDYAVSLIPSKEADLEHARDLVLEALNISAGRPIISIQQRAMEFVSLATRRWGAASHFSDICHAISARKVR
jgi:transcriptional regulator with XRE-family HTH domain